MHIIYLLSVYLHILSAIVWIGGMFFLVLVVVPWLRGSGDPRLASQFLRESGERFRTIGWIAFAVLSITGVFNLAQRGVTLTSFVDPVWLGSSTGKAVSLKLLVFAVVLLNSAVHDFVIGPQATRAILADPRSAEANKMRRYASLFGRLNALLALLLVAAGVVIVRGF